MDLSCLVEPLVTPLIDGLRKLLVGKVVKLIHAGNDLKDLDITRVKAQDILRQLEGHRVQNDCGMILFDNLTEAIYVAEDVVQDCWTFAETRGNADSDTVTKVSLPPCSFVNFVPDLRFRYKMGGRIRKIKSEIEKMLPEIEKLQETIGVEDHGGSSRAADDHNKFLRDEVFGLEEETERLLHILTVKNSRIGDNIHAITGRDGIGKSTLAKMVCNSRKAMDHFSRMIWLSFPDKSEDSELLKSILGQIDNLPYERSKYSDTYYWDLIGRLLVEKNNRLLLVLDGCGSSEVWTELLHPRLSKAAEGSAVLITSNSEVARRMNALEFPKATLSVEDGWRLLRHEVFRNSVEDTGHLEEIGKQFVSKCDGVPLEIKHIGGVLKSKRPVRWEEILSNNIWETDSPDSPLSAALKLKYRDLPYHLKLCFIHCSFFPKKFIFHRSFLVQLWMAEGLVPGDEKNMEKTGIECYNELIARSFLEKEPSYYDNMASTMSTSMHELAEMVSSRHLAKLKITAVEPRHRYDVERRLTEVPSINQASKLRSLVLSKNTIKEIPEEYLKKFRRLRVLDLSYTRIESLPPSVGKLLQLRLMNLSFTALKTLPESIRKLKYLQSLQSCGSPGLLELPRGVVELTQLRCLSLEGNGASLDCLPPGIGELKKLRTLHGFLVNRDQCNLVDLKNLTLLTELELYKLERVSSPDKAREASLGNKTGLETLLLSWSYDAKGPWPSTKDILQVFENLCPPKKCIHIHIVNYLGKTFPSWFTALSLPFLEWLRLENCKFCEQLPPFGELPNLKVLDIREASAVTKIGSEFIGTRKFQKLEELYFIKLDNLQEWSEFKTGAFPRLQKLEIIKCYKLESFSGGTHPLPSLRELIIEGAKTLTQIENYHAIGKLSIRRNQRLKSISDLPDLKFMKIRRCDSLCSLAGLTSLRNLILSDHKIKSLPEWLKDVSSLQRLDLEVDESLLTRIYYEKFDVDKFQNIAHVEVKCYVGDQKRANLNQQQETEDSDNTINKSDLFVSYMKPSPLKSNLPDRAINNSASSSRA